MADNNLRGEKKDHVYYITLARPEKRNAISTEMLQGICRLAEEAVKDPEIRAIILKGEGKLFSAGVDFNALGAEVGPYLGEDGAGGAALRALIYQYQQYMNRIEAVELPIICAMHGRVFGMGVELALACDIRLMSDDCIWCMPELRLGVIADLGGSSRLPKLLGQSRAMEILMTGNEFTAPQALDWGLVSYSYPEEELFAAARKMADDICNCAPLAVGATKKIIKRGDGVDLMTQLDMEVNLQSIILRTQDFQEGIAAMMEKRAPRWEKK